MTNKLFETEENNKKDTNFFKIGKRESSWYEQWIVISSLVKEIRIWNPLMSLYRAHIMMHAWWKQGRDYLLKRLVIESWETFIDTETKNVVNSVMNMINSNTFWETDWVYHLVLLLATRGLDKSLYKPFTTWWESRTGLKFEILWTYLEWITPDIFSGKIKWVKPWSYAYDQHTRKGKKAYNAGQKLDNRWSGSTDGRRASMEIVLKNSKEINWEIIVNTINVDNDFPLSQPKESYDTFIEWTESLEIPFAFPKNLEWVKTMLEMPYDEFKEMMYNDITKLTELWYYNTNKA